MNSFNKLGLVVGLTLCVGMAHAADKKETKRDPSNMPPGAVGMPLPGGSGMPPGAVGMPLPPDSACRRAAGMGAVKEALENSDNGEDCSVDSISNSMNGTKGLTTAYIVKVGCGLKDTPIEESTYLVKTRYKSKRTTGSCRVTSVVVQE